MSEAAPVAEPNRIKTLDVVRGFALLGILAVNAGYFAAPWQDMLNPLLPPLAFTPQTLWAWFVMHVFFELKMVTLFSMLFGVSIYLVGGAADVPARGLVLRRRLAWMVVFGLIHGALIWNGDILLTYAVTGLGVMFMRFFPASRLLTNGLIMYGVSVVGVAIVGAVAPIDASEAERLLSEQWAPTTQEMARIMGGFRGDALASLQANFALWWEFTVNPSSIVFVARTASLMLIGMALYKRGFFSGRSPDWLYVLFTGLGAASLVAVALQAEFNIAAQFNYLHMSRYGRIANEMLSPLISLAYASLFALMVKYGALRFLTDALAAVGRMAFTNYIAQSIVMTMIFYGGRGLGLYGQVDRVTLWGIVLCVWAAQLVWSPLWLARFEMGPLEWLWRRLSYARAVKFVR